MSERAASNRSLRTVSVTLIIGAITALLAYLCETRISWTVEAWLVDRWTLLQFVTRHWLLVLGLILGGLGAILRVLSDE